jgi:hypothetical protein
LEEPIVTKVVRSLEEVKGIAEVWRSWQYHPNSDLDFYPAVLRSRPEILRPHVIVLYRGETPQAMLIGRMEEKKVGFQIGYRTLLRVRARLLTFIYAGLLGNPSSGDCDLMVREIMKSLRQGEADAALLANLRVDSPLYRSATSVPGFWARDFFPLPRGHWSMALPPSAEEFRRRLPSKLRQKQRKLLGALGDSVRVVCYRATEELESMCRDVDTIARKTYQRGLGVGFVDNDQIRTRMHLAAARGWLRGYLLYFGTRPAAFWIGTVYGGKFFSDYMGYDPELAQRSPGIFLVTKAIEEICDRQSDWGALEIDWGFGDAQYKEMLGTCKWEEASLSIFAPTLKGARLNAIRMPALFVDRILRWGLERTSLIAKIKRIWRDRLSKVQGNENSGTEGRSRPGAN